MPVLTRYRREQNGGQHHRPRHRNTVGRRQIRGVLKVNNDDDHRDIEQPVDKRDVNLPGLHFRGVNNTHRRQVPQTHGLASQREDAGDNRLGSDNRRQGGNNQHRNQRPLRRQQKERVFNCFRVFEQQRPLAKVVQHQRRQYHRKPGQANR